MHRHVSRDPVGRRRERMTAARRSSARRGSAHRYGGGGRRSRTASGRLRPVACRRRACRAKVTSGMIAAVRRSFPTTGDVQHPVRRHRFDQSGSLHQRDRGLRRGGRRGDRQFRLVGARHHGERRARGFRRRRVQHGRRGRSAAARPARAPAMASMRCSTRSSSVASFAALRGGGGGIDLRAGEPDGDQQHAQIVAQPLHGARRRRAGAPRAGRSRPAAPRCRHGGCAGHIRRGRRGRARSSDSAAQNAW